MGFHITLGDVDPQNINHFAEKMLHLYQNDTWQSILLSDFNIPNLVSSSHNVDATIVGLLSDFTLILIEN